MKSITLEVIKRDTSLGRGALNRMREEGNLPGIVYGTKIGTAPIIVAKKDLNNVLSTHGINAIITLRINNNNIQTMVKEIQTHPVTGRYWHVDFNEISMDRKIKADIQVHLAGEPEGVKEGGIIQHGDATVEVECLPKDLPDKFTLDISNLKIGDKLTVADLEQTENVKIVSEPEQVLISVIPPVMDNEDEEEQGEPDVEAPASDEKPDVGTEE